MFFGVGYVLWRHQFMAVFFSSLVRRHTKLDMLTQSASSVDCSYFKPTLLTVIYPTIIGLRNPVTVPTVLVRPIITHAYRGAMSNILTLYPECISPDAATPIHIQVTATVAVLA